MMGLGRFFDARLDGLPFVAAKNFGPKRTGAIDWIVIHTTEAPELDDTAHAVAAWFAGPNAPEASAHYCVDDGHVVQCVLIEMVAWGAPGANQRGIHIEHAGYAAQTAEEWADAYSTALLARSADLVAALCDRYDIPVNRLTPEALLNGERGLCGHFDVTNAFSKGKGHTDPGPHFPWDTYISHIKARQLQNAPDSANT